MTDPQPEGWVVLAPERWSESHPGCCQRLAQWLAQQDGGQRRVAFVEPPVSALALHRRPRGGRWHGGLFVFEPRTWLPVRRWPLFDGNATWNGSERFSRPRAGEVLRRAGFARCDVVVMADFGLVHVVRQLQAGCLVVWLPEAPGASGAVPRVVRRRVWEALADADLLVVGREELLQRKGADQALRRVVVSEEEGEGFEGLMREVRRTRGVMEVKS